MKPMRIVVPVLNEAPTLATHLRALQPLLRRGAELVVVDGGSTDETWAIASAHGDRVMLAPRGRAAQMNAGARGANAEVLLFLHADTTLPDNADRLIATALARGYCWGRFDVRIDGAHPVLRATERLMNWRSCVTRIATGDQAIFVRRDTFERMGGFADIPLMEDVELSARLRRLGDPACIAVPVVTSGRRWMKYGAIRTVAKMWMLRGRHYLGADPQRLADSYGYARRPDSAESAVAIMAKAPVPGVAKTRLIPALGPERAARVHRALAIHTTSIARAAALGPIEVWCAPDPSHRFFRALNKVGDVSLQGQSPGDLGERLRAVMDAHFRARPGLALLIIGTDCPILSPGHLQEAARALKDSDAVLIPAEDGGYVLIGMRRPIPQVFDDIRWSTSEVAEATRARLRTAGVSWSELPTLWDVDEPRDWVRLESLLSPASADRLAEGKLAPFTGG